MALRDRKHDGTIDSVVNDNGVSYLKGLLLEEVDLNELSALSEEQRRARLERVVGTLLTREGPLLTNRERNLLVRRVVDEALGLGVLEPLLRDETITEIMVNGHEDIYVERAGHIQRLPLKFSSVEQVYQAIDRIVAGVNRRVDESSPMVDARLMGGERVNVIVPPLAVDGPTITIRRFPRPYSISRLIELGALDDSMAGLLDAMVKAELNIVVSGGTGSGKTTMLNALSSFIPAQERIITIEDAAELALQQNHVIRLESRPPNVEGKGEITIRDLVRNSLRMRPDRIIVGETRGGEALDMLQAMNTGHEGSLATIHANSAEDALLRFETLCTMAELRLPDETLRDQINSAIDCVVQLSRLPDGSRRITEIVLLISRHREHYKMHPVFQYRPEPWSGSGKVTGTLHYFSMPKVYGERIRLTGLPLPQAFANAKPPPMDD
ncbi:CpaF family protein [Nocardioides speluncae]|uniref:CpaF family protein n=1 Tax=Nocardioides speluncae TaxID=2670337 RepID=UPI000D69CF9A|nr:CpaF family protein [Nocardioides speluncae]